MTFQGVSPQSPGPESAEPAVPLCTIIIYDNGTAYRRASRLLARIDRIGGGWIDHRAIPWRIEELAFTDPHAVANGNDGWANLIIISVTRARQLPENLREWLLACIPRRPEPALVVALLGGPEELDPPESPRFQFVCRVAHEAGCDFLAPMSARERSGFLLEAARG